MAIVYTIGYAGRRFNDFVRILKENGISIVVDVRSFPTSKNPDFTKESLEIKLPKAGIRYIHMGRLLGGYRKGGYEKHMETEDYKRGINKLAEWANLGERIVIMCMEKNVLWCHRRYISRTLEDLGIQITHL